MTAKKSKPKRKLTFRYKPGPWSANEEAQIQALGGKMTPEQIARRLRRKVEDVRAKVAEVLGIKAETMVNMAKALESRPEWRQIQKQFTVEEQEEFKHQYVQLMAQFEDDIKPTEELQVFQVVTLKIQIDRILVEQKMALEDLAAAHEGLQKIEDEIKGEVREARKVSMKEERDAIWAKYISSKNTIKDCATNYKIYSDKQDKMLASLKATRDQRVKIFEESKHSFLGFLRLLTREDERIRMGEEMEMMRIAAEKEKDRLASPFVYEDGTEDYPLCTPEVVASEGT
jgi:plasmid maintenance system antidote protein VapI